MMTKKEFANQVRRIVRQAIQLPMTTEGVESSLHRNILKPKRLSWSALSNQQKAALVEPLADIIINEDPRYRPNQWSIPSLDKQDLTGQGVYDALKDYLKDSVRLPTTFGGEVKLVSRQVLLDRLKAFGASRPEWVSFDPITKVGEIHDLDTVMEALIAEYNPNATCTLYVIRFTKGPWRDYFYIGITTMLYTARTDLHIIDAYRTDKETASYRRHHKLARAIRDSNEAAGSPKNVPFEVFIISNDLTPSQACQQEIDLIEEYKERDPEHLLNQQPGGSLFGRDASKVVLLDGTRMFLAHALSESCLEHGIKNVEGLRSRFNQHCTGIKGYKSGKVVEIRPALDKALHKELHGDHSIRKDATTYEYKGHQRSVREIAKMRNEKLNKIRSLIIRRGIQPGTRIDEMLNGEELANGRCKAPKPSLFYEDLKVEDPAFAKAWRDETKRGKLSWAALSRLCKEPQSNIRARACAKINDIVGFWAVTKRV